MNSPKASNIDSGLWVTVCIFIYLLPSLWYFTAIPHRLTSAQFNGDLSILTIIPISYMSPYHATSLFHHLQLIPEPQSFTLRPSKIQGKRYPWVQWHHSWSQASFIQPEPQSLYLGPSSSSTPSVLYQSLTGSQMRWFLNDYNFCNNHQIIKLPLEAIQVLL